MYKVAFVILNYQTFSDTQNLLDDIANQIWCNDVKIYVIDNGSNDENIVKLQKFKESYNFELISLKSNLGFANGNNVGITKARNDGYEFIICSNSDITIKKQDNFLNQIFYLFKEDMSIGIIAPSIKNLDGVYQNPFRSDRFSAKEIVKMKLFYLSYFYEIYYFFRVYIFYELITKLAKKRKMVHISTQTILRDSGVIYAPHGSFLIFTPQFFKYYKGFDKGTFLYCEEFILAEMLRDKNSKCWFENSIEVIHKECGSTNKIANNYKEKVKFTLQHTFASCKYFASKIHL